MNLIRTISMAALCTAALFTLAACEGRETDLIEGAGSDAATTTEGSLNSLTSAEQSEGWQLLFDGSSLADWKGFKTDSISSKWQVDDNVIHFDPDEPGDGGDIITRDVFSNFELAFDWKVGECGNSGVMYLVEEADEHESTWVTGPEYQILDDACFPDAENGANQLAGSAYDVYPVSEDVVRPAGEWNTARIVVNNGQVEHWLNGTRVVEFEMGSEDWDARLAESKWTEYPAFGTVSEGHIALQDHGDPVWYRNIKIRRL